MKQQKDEGLDLPINQMVYKGMVIDSDTGVVLEELAEDEAVPEHETTYLELARAIANGRRIRIKYYTYSRGEENERDVDPWKLVLYRGREYLVGYCYLRQEERTFRLDRILSGRKHLDVLKCRRALAAYYLQGFSC